MQVSTRLSLQKQQIESFRSIVGEEFLFKELGKQYGFKAVCYGHAGDGNLHIRIKKEGTENSQDDPAIIESLRALFLLVKNLGGTVSGEHGIGLVQKRFMDIVFDKTQLDLMRGIKKVFDPSNILNAGKVFDAE